MMNPQSSPTSTGGRALRAWLLLLIIPMFVGVGVRSAGAGTPADKSTFAPLEPIYHFQRDPRLRLPQAGALIGVAQARDQYNVDGTGLAAAVLDTGIRPTHQDFPAGKILEQLNYTGDNAGDPANALDGHGHGTNVSGIIVANGPTGTGQTGHTGIAPGAKILAMKVLANNGTGDNTWLYNALQYLIDNHTRLNITVANLSLGTNENRTSAPTNDAIRSQMAQLRAEKVAVVVSAGNAFYTFGSAQGMAWPAIIPETVSVGAVYDADIGSVSYSTGAAATTTGADRVCPFSQRLHASLYATTATDIFAPGAAITSTGSVTDTSSSTFHGTSQAAPVTAGVILLMQQYHLRLTGQLPTVDDIESWLMSGAIDIVDGDDEVDNVTNTGLDFPRISASGALQAMEADLGGSGNLSGQVTIGALGLGGVQISAGGQTTVTDAEGDYAFSGLTPGAYTVTPSKSPYVFTPASRQVSVEPNAANVDFTAALPTYTISGTVRVGAAALAGVTVTAGDRTATTTTNGSYTITGLPTDTYEVEASKSGYQFTPASLEVGVGPNQSNVNFTAVKVVSISGKVTENKLGLPGVTVTLATNGNSRTTTTAADGTYSFNDVVAATYQITPSRADYLFTPASRTVRATTRPVVGMNFAGAVIPDLTDLTLTAASVKGLRTTTATVLLSGKAPAALRVTLASSDTAAATVPASLVIPRGRSSARITIRTKKVLAVTNVTISATFDGVTESAVLTVTP